MIQMAEVSMQDMQSFLELVYTGKVSMVEERRHVFTGLLELLSVSDDIGERVEYSSGQHNIGGGVTLTRVSKTQTRPVTSASKKISVAITPVRPVTTGPPPVESLLATLSSQLQCPVPAPDNGVDAAQAAADLATKEWLSSSKVGIPQMVRDGDTGQMSLSHADATGGRKCEKCRCPLCMDPGRSAGEPAMHLCHYPNCGKVYKVTNTQYHFFLSETAALAVKILVRVCLRLSHLLQLH